MGSPSILHEEEVVPVMRNKGQVVVVATVAAPTYHKCPRLSEPRKFPNGGVINGYSAAGEDEVPEIRSSYTSSTSSEECEDLSVDEPFDEDLSDPALRSDPCEQVAASASKLNKMGIEILTENHSFTALRLTYLLVTFVIMLADGLQGTHLYVLYEGYGFSVASLYCLGFLTGGILSPITGPLVDKIGRKKAAILYCVFEILINLLEQFPFLPGLVASRMIGGFTHNLLTSVFETWLDTEYRKRQLDKQKYEIIMRDSVIASNVAAILSGYLAHVLAESYGPSGPFRGAVACTSIALLVVSFAWTENFGSAEGDATRKDVAAFLLEAIAAFKKDKEMRLVGIIQGLTAGSIQIFVFLWSPALRKFADSASGASWGLDSKGQPAYGLIFGAYMAAGVLGGLAAPYVRKATTALLSSVDGEGEARSMGVEFLSAVCYFVATLMLVTPCLVSADGSTSFASCLLAFLVYEVLIGVFLPCEGVIRSLYFPANARASVMALPNIIVNGAVSVGVASTNVVSLETAFLGVACLMLLSALLQLSLIPEREWSCLWSRTQSTLLPVVSIPRSVYAIARRFARSISSVFQRNVFDPVFVEKRGGSKAKRE